MSGGCNCKEHYGHKDCDEFCLCVMQTVVTVKMEPKTESKSEEVKSIPIPGPGGKYKKWLESPREELSFHQTFRNITDKMVRELDKFEEKDRVLLYAQLAEHCSQRVRKYLADNT